MFYIFELISRFKYIIFSYCCLFIICYIYYPIFFSFLDFLLKTVLNEQNSSDLNYYIYTHPFELYYSHLFFCFICSLYCLVPYLVWQFIDFIKTGIYNSEYLLLSSFYKKCLLIFIGSYMFLYGYILPCFLEFLQSAKSAYLSEVYTLFFELKIQDFIKFIIYLNTLFTIIILFLIIISVFIFNFSLFNIIMTKKLIYLIAIIFSTFISPPDIASQLLLLIVILLTIEFIIFFRVIKHYMLINKT